MLKFIDLFCGIGGFRIGAEQALSEYDLNYKCVFSSDIDQYAQKSYYTNFGEMPYGDITKIDAEIIPDHDILFAGFPCQPFSIIGNGLGFDDVRGTLFFDIARILKAKRPKAFILENVKRLVGHNKGQTLKRILAVLQQLGYHVDYRILNALDYGLPQKRERVFIVGFDEPISFSWPPPRSRMILLSEILERDVDNKYVASPAIREKRLRTHNSKYDPGIWHENKSGNISSYPYSCALRAGASYNYLLVNGTRRLTPREMLRLQGFPDDFEIKVPDSQIRKQAGNAVPVNIVHDLFDSVLHSLIENRIIKFHNKISKHGITVHYVKENAKIANGRKG